MRKAISLTMAIVIAACLLAGCSTQDEPEPLPTEPPTPTPTATPEPTPTPIPDMTLTVKNMSPFDISEIWISPVPAFEGSEILLIDPDGTDEGELKTEDFMDVSFPSASDSYIVRLIDEDDDEFAFPDISPADGGEMVLSWDGDCYIAEMYDETGEMYASLESVTGIIVDGRVKPKVYKRLESKVPLNDIDLVVSYPSKAFFVLDVEDDFVTLQSKDGEALIEVRVNEPWDGPDRGAMNTAIARYERIAKGIINEKTEGATDVKWYETDIVRTDYEGISNLLYIYSSADYTQGGQPMHTICMVNRWYRVSDFEPFLFSITLTTTIEMLDFYMDNYYYKISDSLSDRLR